MLAIGVQMREENVHFRFEFFRILAYSKVRNNGVDTREGKKVAVVWSVFYLRLVLFDFCAQFELAKIVVELSDVGPGVGVSYP